MAIVILHMGYKNLNNILCQLEIADYKADNYLKDETSTKVSKSQLLFKFVKDIRLII